MSDVSQHDETAAAAPRVRPVVRTKASAKALDAGKISRDKRAKAAPPKAATDASTEAAAKGDPLRAALTSALEKARETQRAVARQEAAIERTRASMDAAGAAVERAQKGVGKAQQAYAAELASAAASETPPPSSGVRKARQAVVDAEDHRDALKAALAKLEKDLPVVVADLRDADVAVEAAISAILLPVARSLLERARSVAATLVPLREALAALWAETDRPTAWDQQTPFTEGRAPLASLREEVPEFFRTTSVIKRVRPDPWAVAREQLRADPNAALTEFDELLG
jgi:hypothetical protein